MADTMCGDCKKLTEVVFDHSSGDTVCSECGLVLESHSIDETSEWRTFADSADDHDPNRVGGPTNPLLSNHLTTHISAAPHGGPSASLNKRASSSDSDSHLISAFKSMAAMADRLGLVPTIKDRANEIYKNVLEDSRSIRGRNHDALLAACLYVACNQEELPRTVKEICSVANGATKKDLGRAKSYIMKQLHRAEFTGMGQGRAIRAADFVKRFCSNLGVMNTRVTKAAQEAAQKAEEDVDIRRSPISIAAAIIYIISQLAVEEDQKKMKPLKDISVATGVAEGTIRNAYKDLHPHIDAESNFGVDHHNFCFTHIV
ncbi:hypothetical protein Cgig2_003893 [Carnegiea gigantea]|uniref:TFIIB-type domain-containing protein n=1 Tax=Carnegiea gigantea TaxID=171969 RepID=A0A9Q1JU01_9CARY|nr:hypothetical protein Cgig2_003893 [Carnegiea gigantea]